MVGNLWASPVRTSRRIAQNFVGAKENVYERIRNEIESGYRNKRRTGTWMEARTRRMMMERKRETRIMKKWIMKTCYLNCDKL